MKSSKWCLANKCTAILVFAFSSIGFSQESYSPYVGHDYPLSVYWGDTHLHTNMSLDVYPFGNRQLGPDAAYRFARGETIVADNGMKARLARPLDFLVVADHAENIGVITALAARDPVLLQTEAGRLWLQRYLQTEEARKTDSEKAYQLSFQMFMDSFTDDSSIGNEEFQRQAWHQVTANADRYNEPGKFTAFIGYEWSANKTRDGTYHRNVIFKDNAQLANQVLPFSAYDSRDPEKLWEYLANYEKTSGGEVLAIPHNINLSAGQAFMLEDSEGQPLNAAYAKARSRWEPLVEVTQTKGDSESHPILSPADEFAGYGFSWTRNGTETEDNLRQYEYARSGLKLGLEQQAKLGVNPFKFGMIGSTDNHTALASIDEDNFWWSNPSPERAKNSFSYRGNAAGYAAVWATENTREALFAAMKRRETYATTGPRMTVHFFGGWDYQSDDVFKPDFARIGYGNGVPMGGDLTNRPKDKAPNFLIRAVKDPDGANLDRVQVIKGWRSKDGELHEKVYNVALSDGRLEDANGKTPPVGNTVNIAGASYVNSIGDPELAVVWTDPDFNPSELAFYYVRVLEIPTPRWTAYDAKFFELKDIPEEVPMITQERAYTSPIWFTP